MFLRVIKVLFAELLLSSRSLDCWLATLTVQFRFPKLLSKCTSGEAGMWLTWVSACLTCTKLWFCSPALHENKTKSIQQQNGTQALTPGAQEDPKSVVILSCMCLESPWDTGDPVSQNRTVKQGIQRPAGHCREESGHLCCSGPSLSPAGTGS